MKVITAVVAVLVLVAPAMADWMPGMPYKTVNDPQLPNPLGWDVRATYYTGLADDFMCGQTGLITDFHIWTSYKGDLEIMPEDVEFIHTALYKDIPADPANPDSYSMPGERVWHHDWLLDPPIGNYVVADWYEQGPQGWIDPLAGIVLDPPDHQMIQQWNFYIDPLEAYTQIEGEIYWLEISFKLTPLAIEQGKRIGWKTSLNHWNDDAVYTEIVDGQPRVWNELLDPYTGESLDLAFVITPEPASIGLLILGGLALIRRR
jgi:hypothetical protein